MRLCFLDLETTGLDPEVDQITEAAWIAQNAYGEWKEEHFFVEHDRLPNEFVLRDTDYLTRILPAAKVPVEKMLERLYHYTKERTDFRYKDGSVQDAIKIAPAHLAGCNPAFDDRFLRKAYRDHPIDITVAWGYRKVYEPSYHYRLVDVEAVVLGALGLDEMPGTKDLRALLGLQGANVAAHTAMGDAREARIAYEAAIKINADLREKLEDAINNAIELGEQVR